MVRNWTHLSHDHVIERKYRTHEIVCNNNAQEFILSLWSPSHDAP